jgi:hypothetical protein
MAIGAETVPRLNRPYARKGGRNFGDGEDGRLGSVTGYESGGRFPANLVVSDEVLGEHSRFFRLPFLITPKASKAEKNKGLESFAAVRRADRSKADGIGGNNPRNRTNMPKKIPSAVQAKAAPNSATSFSMA